MFVYAEDSGLITARFALRRLEYNNSEIPTIHDGISFDHIVALHNFVCLKNLLNIVITDFNHSAQSYDEELKKLVD